MSKLGLISLPLLIYGVWFAIAAFRKKLPSKRILNMHTSLFLMFYLLVTSGLGIFWVANQQLPVFDWHYLFGYGTLLLVFIHLYFNLPPLIKTLKRRRLRTPGGAKPERSASARESSGTGIPTLILVMVISFFIGKYVGGGKVTMPWSSSERLALGPTDAVVAYHQYSSESSEDAFPRAPSIDWTIEVEEFKSVEGEKTKLPKPSEGGRPLSESMLKHDSKLVPMSLQTLSDILFHTNGITAVDNGYKLRAAPSSGALAPTEIYVQTPEIDGLCGGAYHYDPEHHQLTRIGDCKAPKQTTFYVTSVFRRTGKKYEDRAYRYAIADAGHMLENLRICAGEFGYAAQPLARFDESRVERILGISGPDEGVIAAIELRSHLTFLGKGTWQFLAPPKETDLGVTGTVQKATSLEQVNENGQPLPAPSKVEAPTYDAIKDRRSDRRFSDTDITLADLSALLLSTQGPGRFLSRGIVLRFVANRVEGLKTGLYRYLPESHAIVLEREEDLANEAYEVAFSQDVIGKAAIAFIGSVDRRYLFADHGARGYRHAFLEVGMMSERLLLAATVLKLYACPVGAFFDDGAAKLIGSTMEKEWVLHFIGLGAP